MGSRHTGGDPEIKESCQPIAVAMRVKLVLPMTKRMYDAGIPILAGTGLDIPDEWSAVGK
jgi:hypothetical protein